MSRARFPFHGRCLALIGLILAAAPASAQDTYTWNTTTVNNAWLNTANWTGGELNTFPGGTAGALSGNGATDDTAVIGTFAFSASSGLGIDMSPAAANGLLSLGAIQFTSGTSNLQIGSSGGNGTLWLTGATVNGVNNVLLANTSASKNLTIANTASGAGAQTTDLLLGLTGVFLVNSGRTITVNSTITDGFGNHGFTVQGGGTVVVTGANTYTGATTVSGGTLLVMGQTGSTSGTGAGAVAVNSTGTLGGTGRAGGAVMVDNGGTIRGGDAAGAGTLTIGGGLTFNDGAHQLIRISDASTPSAVSGGSTIGNVPNPTSNNFLDILGGVSFSGDTSTYRFIVDGTGITFDPTKSYSYQVGRSNGQDVSFINLSNPAQFTTVGFSESFNFMLSGNSAGAVFLTMSPVPEPSAVLGIAAGLLCLGALVRRRRHFLSGVSPSGGVSSCTT